MLGHGSAKIGAGMVARRDALALVGHSGTEAKRGAVKATQGRDEHRHSRVPAMQRGVKQGLSVERPGSGEATWIRAKATHCFVTAWPWNARAQCGGALAWIGHAPAGHCVARAKRRYAAA